MRNNYFVLKVQWMEWSNQTILVWMLFSCIYRVDSLCEELTLSMKVRWHIRIYLHKITWLSSCTTWNVILNPMRRLSMRRSYRPYNVFILYSCRYCYHMLMNQHAADNNGSLADCRPHAHAQSQKYNRDSLYFFKRRFHHAWSFQRLSERLTQTSEWHSTPSHSTYYFMLVRSFKS